ncbi:MAG: phage major capsid protein [Bdellovibrionales bacterium]
MSKKTLAIGKQHRAIAKEDYTLNAETREITISFSSELPVERWFGMEILSHAAGCCDLSRFENKAMALFNHRWDEYVGVIESARIDADKRGYCTVRFSKSEFADQVMKDVADGIIVGVSFGYQILEMILSKQSDTGPSEYTAVKWQPYEVSFCTVPADITVGVGRAETDLVLEVPILNQRSIAAQIQEKPKMTPEEIKAAELKAAQELQTARTDAAKAERDRASAIRALGEKFTQADLARQLVESGASIEDARGAFLEKLGFVQKPVSEKDGFIGLNEKEIGQFSFIKAIRAMMNPTDPRAQEDAKFEREVSDAAVKESKREARGFLVPFDILRAMNKDPRFQRDQLVSSSTGGGNLVGTVLQSGSFIDLLRNMSICQQAGASVLSGLQGNIAIPRKTTASTVYWVAENTAPTEGSVAFDQVTMSPKTVGGYVDYSRKLMLQSSPDIESLIRSDLAESIALELDRVGLYGLGSSNQPLGLKGTTGVLTKDFAAGAPTWAEIVNLETQINSANAANLAVMKYITNGAGQGDLKTTAKSTNAALFLMEDGQCNGYDVLMSNQVASGDHWFGAWNQLMFGFWSGLDILIDPYTGGAAGTVRVIAHQDADIGVRQPTAFCRGNDTL